METSDIIKLLYVNGYKLYVNCQIMGTRFYVQVLCSQSVLSVFPAQILLLGKEEYPTEGSGRWLILQTLFPVVGFNPFASMKQQLRCSCFAGFTPLE